MGAVSAEEHNNLRREYEEFRATSREFEEELEDEIRTLRDENTSLTGEVEALRARRRREVREGAEMQERLEQQARSLQDMRDKTKDLREKVRALEVEQEGWEKERRQMGTLVLRTQHANEELQEEIVLLQGELREAVAAKDALTRSHQHLSKELEEAKTCLPGQHAAAPRTPIATPPAEALTPSSSVFSPHTAGAATPDVAKYTSILRDVQQALTDAFNLEPEWVKMEHEVLEHMAACPAY